MIGEHRKLRSMSFATFSTHYKPYFKFMETFVKRRKRSLNGIIINVDLFSTFGFATFAVKSFEQLLFFFLSMQPTFEYIMLNNIAYNAILYIISRDTVNTLINKTTKNHYGAAPFTFKYPAPLHVIRI